jgi:hypothetical protein
LDEELSTDQDLLRAYHAPAVLLTSIDGIHKLAKTEIGNQCILLQALVLQTVDLVLRRPRCSYAVTALPLSAILNHAVAILSAVSFRSTRALSRIDSKRRRYLTRRLYLQIFLTCLTRAPIALRPDGSTQICVACSIRDKPAFTHRFGFYHAIGTFTKYTTVTALALIAKYYTSQGGAEWLPRVTYSNSLQFEYRYVLFQCMHLRISVRPFQCMHLRRPVVCAPKRARREPLRRRDISFELQRFGRDVSGDGGGCGSSK